MFHTLGLVKREVMDEDIDGESDVRVEIERQAIQESAAIVAASEIELAELRDLYGADPARVRIIPCGVDPMVFRPMRQADARDRLGRDQCERIVLFVGRIEQIKGIDVLLRPTTFVPVRRFDGAVIPHPDRSFDAVLFVDVLHHTPDPAVLLREAARVARRCVVVKDHTMDGPLSGPLLRFMDWVGNERHGVALPYNYWSSARWSRAFAELGLTVAEDRRRLGLYPPGAEWVFGDGLHRLTRLDVGGPARG